MANDAEHGQRRDRGEAQTQEEKAQCHFGQFFSLGNCRKKGVSMQPRKILSETLKDTVSH